MVDHEEVLSRGLHHPGAGHVRWSPPAREPEEGSLLVSPAFWIGGLLCLLIWISAAAFFGFL